jgi:hypothetical protein
MRHCTNSVFLKIHPYTSIPTAQQFFRQRSATKFMAGYMLFRAWQYIATQPPQDNSAYAKHPAEFLGKQGVTDPWCWTPEFRFDMSDGGIYGFPAPTPDSPSLSYLVIPNSSPAVRLYILGPAWDSRLSKVPPYSQGCIPIPDDPVDEARHCLLMKRFGAELMDATLPARPGPAAMNPYRQISKRQLMGWPTTGGVWVYRLPQVFFKATTVEEDMQYLGRIADGKEEDYEHELRELKRRLSKQLTMEDYCNVLKEKGATFYLDPASCPEVKLLGLLEQGNL